MSHDEPQPPDPPELKLERDPDPEPQPAAAPQEEPQHPAQPPPAEERPGGPERPGAPPATRRSLLARLVGLAAAVPFLGGAVLALRAGLAPVPEELPERVPLGRLRDVPERGLLRRAVTFPVRRGPRVEAVTEVVFLTRHRGNVIAFSARCTHQGCPVVAAKEVAESTGPAGPPLVCPCHGGAYTATGEPAGGPVKERLPRLRLDLPDTPDGTIQWVRIHG